MTRSARRLLILTALLTVAVVLVAPTGFTRDRIANRPAPAPKTPPAGVTPAPSPAYLRFWKTDLPGTADLHLTWTLTGAVPPRARNPKPATAAAVAPEVARAGIGYQFSDYAPVPSGRGTATVVAEVDGHALASLSADLVANASYTVLLTPTGAEVIADGPAPAAGVADFAVRVLAPGLRDLRVSVGESFSARFEAPNDGLLRMRGLKAALMVIRTEGTDAAGKPFEWTTEADFLRTPRQTLLVYPDPYGRVRPRLTVDGPVAGEAKSADKAKPPGN